MIALCEPYFCGNEKKYVDDALEQGWVSTGGSYINKFQKDFQDYLHADGAVACQSGTAGLHLTLVDAKIGDGDLVIAATLTFIAAVNIIKYVHAEPVFIGCDDSLCIDPDAIEAFIENECSFDGTSVIHKKTNKPVKAIIAVHIFGNMCDMEKLIAIKEKYNLILIEDATEALGTKYISGKYDGCYAGTIGDYGVFSFNGNKIITTGGGGMIVAKNAKNLEHIQYLSTQCKDDPVKYVHNEVGYNYRMTNVQAAIGVGQMEVLEKYVEAKRKNYQTYCAEFKKIGIELVRFRTDIRSNCWFYSLILDESYTEDKRNKLIDEFKENDVLVRPIWGLIHKQLPYRNCISYRVEKALDYERKIVNIPCSVNLSNDDLMSVVKISNKLIER